MRSETQRTGFLSPVTTGCILLLCALCCAFPAYAATTKQSHIMTRPELESSRRDELAQRLREITGWMNLHFDAQGVLRSGQFISGGSGAARELLTAAASGEHLLVLEDASNRSDVVFCRVVAGRWTRDATARPPVQIILIDFADFAHVRGDRAALKSFNVGWGLLHEIAHVVHDANDAGGAGEVGECEKLINAMRRECGMAERAEYFYTLLPGLETTDFKTRFVRLAFEARQPDTKRKQRYWIIWDARVVGEGETARRLTRQKR
ncbi:MAG: hypothetical protein ACR2G4_18255 [Pyrinomonadaceae bacterium]